MTGNALRTYGCNADAIRAGPKSDADESKGRDLVLLIETRSADILFRYLLAVNFQLDGPLKSNTRG